MTRFFPALFGGGLLIAGMAVAAPAGSVVDTRHNLSVSGPGPVRAANETEVCVFCHAAHPPESGPSLWNHLSSPKINYRPYARETLTSQPGQPDGSSVLCLSCHDGTVALGAIHTRDTPIRLLGVSGTGRMADDRSANLGTDLSGTHPISVPYAQALADGGAEAVRVRPLSTEEERTWLDPSGKVQCTSCHDPHDDPVRADASVPPFWRGESVAEVCETCHVAPLVNAPHADPRLLGDACGSCHVGHGQSGEALLAGREEGACFTCHGTSESARKAVADGSIHASARPGLVETQFSLLSHHPVTESRGLHEPGEDLGAQGAAAPRHVECVDCHTLHGEQAPYRIAAVRGRGAPVSGVLGGLPEFEVCYGCHGSVANLPFGETDKSAEFDPNNRSYHPVEQASHTSNVPSLLSPFREGERMTCSDCHTSDDPARPQGPHGSRYPWILKAPYTATDGQPESTRAYELCYGCHSRSVILSDQSFAGHAEHVVSEEASCYACHDSHGSPLDPGLVRFGKDIRYTSVSPSSSGRLEYDEKTGNCWLSCHGADHNPLGYGL